MPHHVITKCINVITVLSLRYLQERKQLTWWLINDITLHKLKQSATTQKVLLSNARDNAPPPFWDC